MEKLLLALICLASANVCLVRLETTETWGELNNVRALDQKTAIARWFVFVVQSRTLRFPAVNSYNMKGRENQMNCIVFVSNFDHLFSMRLFCRKVSTIHQ